MNTICDVYKSIRQPDMYIYVDREDGLTRIPSDLLDRFGQPELALSFILTPGRKLAKEDSEKVQQNLVENGFHLQLPPVDAIKL